MASNETNLSNSVRISTVVVKTKGFENWFKSLYHSIHDMLFFTEPNPWVKVINETDFVLCCRYIMKGRIEYVFSQLVDKQYNQKYPLPIDVELPESLAIVINGVGAHTILNGTVTLIPKPDNSTNIYQNNDADLSQLAFPHLLPETFTLFSRLIRMAAIKCIIRTGQISTSTTGTAFWLLRTQFANKNSKLLFEENIRIGTKVKSPFPQFKHNDSRLAAIVQNKYHAQIAGIPEKVHDAGTINYVPCLREKFNLNPDYLGEKY